MSTEQLVHLIAGGFGGTVGAVVTCPLEVLKTRLQSSVATFGIHAKSPVKGPFGPHIPQDVLEKRQRMTIIQCFRHIVKTEGVGALWKGIGPNIVGIAPSRAIYFLTYASTKSFCNEKLTPDTPLVHIISAAAAGFVCSTTTNPIWFVKTRLQLDESQKSVTAWQCIRDTYRQNGIRPFYKGLSASYFGISETIIHFVIYEFIKSKLCQVSQSPTSTSSVHGSTRVQNESKLNLFHFMAAAATSKFIASVAAYPHEVARTRLREEGDKYTKFFRTLFTVYREEGIRGGLYRGLGTHLLRQIPNTAITMGIYEVTAYYLKTHISPGGR